jgi:uroporphyrinogen-III synthase
VRLLLTRPEPDAERTAAALRLHGHDVVSAPLTRIEPIADAPLGAGASAILITSANAASAITAHTEYAKLLGLPVFAVGQRSAQAMRAAGFDDVTSADGDVGDLARTVARRVEPGARLIYFAGEDRAGDLGGDLRARGFDVRTSVVYRAVIVTRLPDAATEALSNGIEGVLHFSRSAAEAYMTAASGADLLESALQPAHFCLSNRVAEPLARAGAKTIHIAPRPTEAALIALISANPA